MGSANRLKDVHEGIFDRMTPDFVNLSIGLRAPQLYEETKQLIMSHINPPDLYIKISKRLAIFRTSYYDKIETENSVATVQAGLRRQRRL